MSRIYTSFVCTPAIAASPDATEWLKSLPRNARKTMRVHTPKTAPSAKTINHEDVGTYMAHGYRVDTYHTQNLEFLDRGYDFDEFQDIDNEYAGLTITEPMDEVELFEFCTGYNL